MCGKSSHVDTSTVSEILLLLKPIARFPLILIGPGVYMQMPWAITDVTEKKIVSIMTPLLVFFFLYTNFREFVLQ